LQITQHQKKEIAILHSRTEQETVYNGTNVTIMDLIHFDHLLDFSFTVASADGAIAAVVVIAVVVEAAFVFKVFLVAAVVITAVIFAVAVVVSSMAGVEVILTLLDDAFNQSFNSGHNQIALTRL